MIFIFGKEEYLINQKIKKFLKNFNLHDINVYDEITKTEDIMMDILTIPMFSNQKTIIIKDHMILKDNNEGKRFLKDFQLVNKNNLNLFFVLNSMPLESNPFIKYLLKNAEIHKVKTFTSQDISKVINQLVDENGGTITDEAIIKLLQKFPINLRIIVNEMKKLLFENKNITKKEVNSSVFDYHSEDYFAFSDAIIKKNKLEIIKYYNEKLMYGNLPISIISQIASVFNLSIIVDNYKKQGYSLNEISKTLKIHIFRIKKANKLIEDWDSQTISKLIVKLSNLERDIKIGEINNLHGLNRFILQLIK